FPRSYRPPEPCATAQRVELILSRPSSREVIRGAWMLASISLTRDSAPSHSWATDFAGPVPRRPGLDLRGERHPMLLAYAAGVAAGREAENVRRLAPEIPNLVAGQPLDLRDRHAFRLQDGLFGLRPDEAVAADAAVAPNHPMARNEQRDRILGQRRSNCPRCTRVTDLARNPAVGPDLAWRNLQRFAQHRLLERRQPVQIEAQRMPPVAGQPFPQRPSELLRRARHDTHLPSHLALEPALEFGSVGRVEDGRQAALIEGHVQRAQGRIEREVAVAQPDRAQHLRPQRPGRLNGAKTLKQAFKVRLAVYCRHHQDTSSLPGRDRPWPSGTPPSGCICDRSQARPRCTLLLAVPNGQPVAAATSA